VEDVGKDYLLKKGKRPTSHRYNHIPLLCSHPGGFYRSWSCRTCHCKYKAILYFCKCKLYINLYCILHPKITNH